MNPPTRKQSISILQTKSRAKQSIEIDGFTSIGTENWSNGVHVSVVSLARHCIAGSVAIAKKCGGVKSNEREQEHHSRASDPTELCNRPCQWQNAGSNHCSYYMSTRSPNSSWKKNSVFVLRFSIWVCKTMEEKKKLTCFIFFLIITCSFETTIIVEAFEGRLWRDDVVDDRVEDLVAVVVVMVVVGGSCFTHLLICNKPKLVYLFIWLKVHLDRGRVN